MRFSRDFGSGCPIKISTPVTGRSWNPPRPTACPNDILIVEDDLIIALDFEDTILGFGDKADRREIAETLLERCVAGRAQNRPRGAA